MIAETTRTLVAAAAAAALMAAPAAAQAARTAPQNGPHASDAPKFMPGEVLVRFKPGVDGAERADVRRDEDVTLEEKLPVPRLQQVDTDRGTSVREAARALERRPEVAYAQPNFVRHVAAQPDPDESLFGDLWGLQSIEAPQAWDLETGGQEVKVAVVDSGVDYEHPDLAPNIWDDPQGPPGKDFCGESVVQPSASESTCDGNPAPDAEPTDENGHGTHVAGTIGAANNGLGLVGVSWSVSIMPVRVASADGWTTDALLAEGFDYAAANGAKVVNASFGGAGNASDALADAVKRWPGTLFVVAAGNEGKDNDKFHDFLCNIDSPNLVCVTASNESDNRAGFGNFGVSSVDLAAPGVNILSTIAGPSATPLSDDFETDPLSAPPDGSGDPPEPRWSSEGQAGEDPEPENPDVGPAEAPWAWVDTDGTDGTVTSTDGSDPEGDYQPNTVSHIKSERFSLARRRGCVLDYDLQLALDSTVPEGDRLVVEALHGPGEQPEVLQTYTQSTEAGPEAPLSLADVEDRPEVRLRFTLETDGEGTADGAELDDVSVKCGYELFNGTSMASPHVAGVAALGFAHAPPANPAGMRRALMAGVDKSTAFASTASGGRLDARRTLDLLTSVPPTARITSHPDQLTRVRRPTFRFSASRAAVTFECRLDGGAVSGSGGFSECGSSLRTPRLGDGPHELRVRARGAGGTTAPWDEAESFEFYVDRTGPRMGISAPLELKRRRVPVHLVCPASERFGRCSGRVVVRSKGRLKVGKRRQRVTLGRSAFSVRRGDDGRTAIRVSRRHRRAIERRGRLRVVVRAVASDLAGNTRATSKTTRLLAG